MSRHLSILLCAFVYRLKWLHDDDKFAYLISSESYGQLSAFFNHRQRLVTATGLK